MGRASAVLSRPGSTPGVSTRLLLAPLAIAALAVWDAHAERLPELADRWDVALIAVFVIPGTFVIVWLLEPLATRRGLLPVLLASAVLAVLLDLAGLESLFNATKVVVFALFGFWFLELLEALWWVVLVAALVPLVDILSVYRGPTKVVVEEEPGLFERIAIAFALPGEDAAARLGPPDVIFFALFLAAATRFGLRRGATWVGMTAAISATLVLTYALELDGLPALPAVSLGFLAPNADLLWARWRARGATDVAPRA